MKGGPRIIVALDYPGAAPAQAVAAGATHLVIGRPITRAPDPIAAIAAIGEELGD